MNILIEHYEKTQEIVELINKNHTIHYCKHNVYNDFQKYKPNLYIGTSNIKNIIECFKEYKCYGLIIDNNHVSFYDENGGIFREEIYDAILESKKDVVTIGCYQSDIMCINEKENRLLLKLCNNIDKFRIRIFGKDLWNCPQFIGKIYDGDILSSYYLSKIVFTSDLNKAINASQYSLVITDNPKAEKYGIITVATYEDLYDVCYNLLISNPHIKSEQQNLILQKILSSDIPTYLTILREAEVSYGIKIL